MKGLRQIIFTTAMVIGLALTASAQKPDDPKHRPPKDPPPKVNPGPKERPPRGNPPPKDDRKKPGAFYFVSVNRDDDIV